MTEGQGVPDKLRRFTLKSQSVPNKLRQLALKSQGVPNKLRRLTLQSQSVPDQLRRLAPKCQSVPMKLGERPLKLGERPLKLGHVVLLLDEAPTRLGEVAHEARSRGVAAPRGAEEPPCAEKEARPRAIEAALVRAHSSATKEGCSSPARLNVGLLSGKVRETSAKQSRLFPGCSDATDRRGDIDPSRPGVTTSFAPLEALA